MKKYNELIKEEIDKINDEKFLKFIYNLIQSFKRIWGY